MSAKTLQSITGALCAGLAALLLALPVAAQNCDKPDSREIQIPDGASASREEMLAARQAVTRFVERMDAYLNCLDQHLEQLPDDETGDRGREINYARYNAARDEKERLAERFNMQVRVYQVRQERPE